MGRASRFTRKDNFPIFLSLVCKFDSMLLPRSATRVLKLLFFCTQYDIISYKNNIHHPHIIQFTILLRKCSSTILLKKHILGSVHKRRPVFSRIFEGLSIPSPRFSYNIGITISLKVHPSLKPYVFCERCLN